MGPKLLNSFHGQLIATFIVGIAGMPARPFRDELVPFTLSL